MKKPLFLCTSVILIVTLLAWVIPASSLGIPTGTVFWVCHFLGPGKASRRRTKQHTQHLAHLTSTAFQVWLVLVQKMKNAVLPTFSCTDKDPNCVIKSWYMHLRQVSPNTVSASEIWRQCSPYHPIAEQSTSLKDGEEGWLSSTQPEHLHLCVLGEMDSENRAASSDAPRSLTETSGKSLWDWKHVMPNAGNKSKSWCFYVSWLQ